MAISVFAGTLTDDTKVSPKGRIADLDRVVLTDIYERTVTVTATVDCKQKRS